MLLEIVGPENLKADEPLKNHTSFKLGGPVDFFVTPEGREQLMEVIKLCRAESLPYYIMGNGTNLIVRDKGLRGVVIKIFEKFKAYSVEGEVITAEAGLLLSEVANVALKHGLAGLEFASGIPGTLGGAVAMNAGAYIGEMKDVVVRTEFIDKNGEPGVVEGEEHHFGYRKSFIQETGGIVLRSQLKLKKGNKAEIKALMGDLNQRRRDKQPLKMPSAGSVFKRPPGYFAGKLIEDCGLKGYRLGGAEVSPMHCGFIVNADNATTEDVVNLIRHIQRVVKEKFGVELEREVRIIGEE